MHTEMSLKTRQETLARLRHFYKSAGPKHKSKLIQDAIDLLGYHRKAAIRALNASSTAKPTLKGAGFYRPASGVLAREAAAFFEADLVCGPAAVRASFACAIAGVVAGF
jgi:hypothetical protein